MLGIEHVKAALDKLGDLASHAIDLGKHGIGVSAISDILNILKDVRALLAELPQAMPEMADLDGHESAELAKHAYEMIRRMSQKLAL